MSVEINKDNPDGMDIRPNAASSKDVPCNNPIRPMSIMRTLSIVFEYLCINSILWNTSFVIFFPRFDSMKIILEKSSMKSLVNCVIDTFLLKIKRKEEV